LLQWKRNPKGRRGNMMNRLKKLTAVLIAAVFCITFIEPATALDKESLIERVQTAFDKQVSLSEKPRSMEEINAILETHFTDGFKDKFTLENVIETDEGFQTFGSDFASYYIPNFSYSDKTRAVKKGKTVYLVEYITYEEGPVYFEDGFQGVRLEEINGVLKINDIFYRLPEELEGEVKKDEASPSEKAESVKTAEGESKVTPLSSSYMIKQHRIFEGYFLDAHTLVHLI
jgi:hypothetical protein